MDRRVVLTGCSGGGKSTLLAELARRGFAVVDEPGRRIIAAETASGGQALPWVDLEAFARRAVDMALDDLATAPPGLVFFDRGLIDAAAALDHATGGDTLEALGRAHRYDAVFLAPPWPEIWAQDFDRRHGFDEAAAEYERLVAACARLDYDVTPLPFADVPERADFVLAKLGV